MRHVGDTIPCCSRACARKNVPGLESLGEPRGTPLRALYRNTAVHRTFHAGHVCDTVPSYFITGFWLINLVEYNMKPMKGIFVTIWTNLPRDLQPTHPVRTPMRKNVDHLRASEQSFSSGSRKGQA